MRLINFVARFVGKEWDSYTRSFVRLGWIAERQAIMDEAHARWKMGFRSGGVCLECGRPTDDHPMPDRLWRSGPDLCARVVRKES